MLTLPIKKNWLRMIMSGEKKEEYRKISQFYDRRLKRYVGQDIDVVLRNGYSPRSMIATIHVHVSIGKGKKEWGALSSEDYYVLSILEVKK